MDKQTEIMFQTGNKNFWIAQLVGWGLVGGSNLLVQLIGGFYPIQYIILNALVPFGFGFLVSTAFRYVIRDRKWKSWNITKIILLIIISTVAQAFVLNGMMFSFFHIFTDEPGITLPRVLSNIFIFGVMFLTWNMIYFFIHYFNHWHNSEIEKWKLAAEIKDVQLGALKSQINPHFIFNAINNIRSLILEDKERARGMLLNFSDLFRYSLKHNDHSLVRLEEEVEIVEQYLELLSIQFEDKLKYKLNINSELKEKEIPPMILQILVENAVKHGISQYKSGGIIEINIHGRDDFFFLDVKNSGSLKTKTSLGEKLGVGLENIKRRLELIYEGAAQFQMSEENDFVTASVKIPTI